MKLTPVSAAVLSVLAANFVHAENDHTVMEEVVVTANQIEQPLSEVAGSVSVISGKTLKKKAQTELYDALNNEPGVSVTGGAGRPQNIAIRGMTGNRIMIVRDGVQSADGFGANDINDKVGRNSFDLTNVKSIEVVKGASSSIHGSGALGGTVVIESMQPGDYLKNDDFYADVAATYSGVSDKILLMSNLAFRRGETDSLLTAAYWQGQETRNYQQNNYQRELEGVSAGYQLNHFVGDALMFSVAADAYREEQVRREGSPGIHADGHWDQQHYYQDASTTDFGLAAGLEYHPIESVWFDEAKAKLYWREMTDIEDNNRLYSRPDQNGITEQKRTLDNNEFSDQLLGFRADMSKSFQTERVRHQLAYGVKINSNRYSRSKDQKTLLSGGSSIISTQPFTPAKAQSVGVYGLDMMEFGRWTTTLGLRFDAHRLTPDGQTSNNGFATQTIDSQAWSPSLSIARQIAKSHQLYLSYNHGYRAPAYDKAYGFVSHEDIPFTPFVIIPNMDLKAETSQSFEVGHKFDNGTSRLYVALFYQQFDDFIDVKEVGMVGPVTLKQYQNLNGVETYGAEFSAAHQVNEQWLVSAKAGYVDGKNDQGEYIRTLTPWEGNIELSYDHQAWSASLLWSWAASMDRVPVCVNSFNQEVSCATTEAWNRFDLFAAYQWNPDLTISASVINVLDNEYLRYQDVAGISQANTAYSTEPGRYFTVNVNYQF